MHFKSPFRMLCVGPSMAGKSVFIQNLVNNLDKVVCGEPISQILWCYKNENSIPKALNPNLDVKFHQGIPTVEEINPGTLVVLDDLMMQCFTKDVVELFTVHSHHRNISTILVLHNLFFQNKLTRNISLNTQYIVYFKNPRDLSSLGILARQICPSNWRNLQKLFNETLEKPFSYLIIDMVQDTLEVFKYRNNIFNQNGEFNYYTTKDQQDKLMQYGKNL